jgi:hypothetical protein
MHPLQIAAQHLNLFANEPADSSGIGWQLSPTPFALNPQQVETLHQLGPVLHQFIQAQNTLYTKSSKSQMPSWLAGYLNQGKPDALLQLARNKRFKHDTPLLIRPDLLITDNGFALTEIDSVPGGLGFLAGLHHLYQQSDFTLVGSNDAFSHAIAPPIAHGFANWLQTLPQPTNLEASVQVVVVSDEAKDYWLEWHWLISQLQVATNTNTPPKHTTLRLAHPQDLYLNDTTLMLKNTDGTPDEPVSLIYRFFELFDLDNVPKWPLIQYAIQKGWVACTPPLRPQFEEKLWLALWHHPLLRQDWQGLLTPQAMAHLQAIIPESWILDPATMPAGGAITPTLINPLTQAPLQHWADTTQWGKKHREWVIKPSGFSPLAWGSRGVSIGHDMPQEDWAKAVQRALASFEHSPHIMQRFNKPKSQPYAWLAEDGRVNSGMGRTRLCPYYLVHPDERIELLGVLATTCPADKKIIHGMKDAVLAPCYVG